MASRKADREAARERRLEQERTQRAAAQRRQRLSIVGGLLAVVIAVAVVLVIVLGGGSGGSGNSHLATRPADRHARTVAAQVDNLLRGIPQHETTLGNLHAPVTLTMYGDLQCPICAEFSEGAEKQLIANEVRDGKVKLVYKSFETATANGPDADQWSNQQSAAYAAGVQGRAWNYILLFYRFQGEEGTNYVNTEFIQGIAKQIPGLDFQKWNSDRFNPIFAKLVSQENADAAKLDWGSTEPGTPALIASGPSSQTRPIAGNYPYSTLQRMIREVS